MTSVVFMLTTRNSKRTRYSFGAVFWPCVAEPSQCLSLLVLCRTGFYSLPPANEVVLEGAPTSYEARTPPSLLRFSSRCLRWTFHLAFQTSRLDEKLSNSWHHDPDAGRRGEAAFAVLVQLLSPLHGAVVASQDAGLAFPAATLHRTSGFSAAKKYHG